MYVKYKKKVMVNHCTIFLMCKSVIIQFTITEKNVIVCYISLGKKVLMLFLYHIIAESAVLIVDNF